MSLIVIVQQSSSFVFVWLCTVLRCWLLLSLLFCWPIREPLPAATGWASTCTVTAVRSFWSPIRSTSFLSFFMYFWAVCLTQTGRVAENSSVWGFSSRSVNQTIAWIFTYIQLNWQVTENKGPTTWGGGGGGRLGVEKWPASIFLLLDLFTFFSHFPTHFF